MALYSAEDAKYLKRRIRGGQIDVHPTEKALIVNYSIEATVLDEYQNTMIGDKKDAQKIIRLKSLGPSTDIRALAKEVINRCKLIHPTKLLEVEQLLFYLQNRRDTNLQSDSTTGDSQKPLSDELEQPSIDTQINETASLNDIDDYAEMLYEGVQDKIKGSALILQLARNPDNLSEIIQKESVLNVLTRVYKEEWQQSIELATNIVYIFFCFSSFTDFHPLVSQYRIGAQTMTIVEAEMKKYDQWMEEIAREQKKKQRDTRANITIDNKYKALIRKQEQFLRVAFYLLLNLAEDLKVELKMRNKSIITQLIHALDRDNNDLLILVVSFLKKLSVFVENKNDMVSSLFLFQ
ncbi:unnamed protein product [Rotaria sp. Silwood2]|nr:unnamed protein product [Rotaria sp. Silwood2]CAF2554363.1 unnamed protein product [Rotaria sp. Silwood2]CAF2804915.1 unnamed protein product [Rotaria sp. Silwood2]CAF2961685.1 unnamed protein product [Rotaria sp. Silwood2]CAF3880472.1 unnamed protein product [Rotaria sp. Silwood2]